MSAYNGNGNKGEKAQLKRGETEIELSIMRPVTPEACDLVRPKKKWGERHLVTLLLFFGMANAYVMRTNMSVAIVAMVNHTALPTDLTTPEDLNECSDGMTVSSNATVAGIGASDGKKEVGYAAGRFVWSSIEQNNILSSFFYGYVLTQIPFGILSKKYGAVYFLGIGMLVNSIFAFLVPMAASYGIGALLFVRFIQGLGEGPIVPCTHAILAKWIPPDERSRMGAFVYAGAQFGTIISMPVSGILAANATFGWPSIFYFFGILGCVWSVLFLIYVFEEPDAHPNIAEDEKKYIVTSVWGNAGVSSPPTPWTKIITSPPFWAILIAHMGHNYGYETLLTQLPTFMKQVLHFDIKSNGWFSSLPYLAMWLFSMAVSHLADKAISTKYCSITNTRKILNSIGQYGPAIALVAASYTGCDPYLTVFVLTFGIGLNGAIYSGFKVNHLDISPRFAGILMSFTNCLANFSGLLAPNVAGRIINLRPTQAAWRTVFCIASGVYAVACTIYLILGSGERQPWDDESKDASIRAEKEAYKEKRKKAKVRGSDSESAEPIDV